MDLYDFLARVIFLLATAIMYSVFVHTELKNIKEELQKSKYRETELAIKLDTLLDLKEYTKDITINELYKIKNDINKVPKDIKNEIRAELFKVAPIKLVRFLGENFEE